jgi:glycosyltransferase involved in cell wall biosynthesis
MKEKIKISLVVITLNEEINIENCLRSASFVDEIIIIDSGSTDRTGQIAQTYNARFIFNRWPGYGQQKQFAIEQASNDWVLLLDADEFLDVPLQEEIKELFKHELKFDAYTIPRKQVFMNKQCHYGKSIDYPIRLCNRKKGRFDLKNIHESFFTDGISGNLKNFMIHNSAVNVLDRCKKICRDIEIEIINNNNQSIKVKNIVIDPIRYFLSYFFKKKGYRDGVAGYILNVLFAIQIFLLNAAYYEKNMTIKKSIKGEAVQ